MFNLSVISLASCKSFVRNNLKASFSSPILPQAFILGAIPKDIVVEFTSLYPVDASKVLKPIFFDIGTSFNPNLVITLFSSTSGTISEIVPTHTISKYFKYSLLSKFNLIEIACISLNTTPTPAN